MSFYGRGCGHVAPSTARTLIWLVVIRSNYNNIFSVGTLPVFNIHSGLIFSKSNKYVLDIIGTGLFNLVSIGIHNSYD